MEQRVGAYLSIEDGTAQFLGFGTYVGNEVPPEDDSNPSLNLLHKNNVANPKIVLDSGKVVWGCECWWDSEEKVKAELAQMEVIEVDIDEVRAEYAPNVFSN